MKKSNRVSYKETLNNKTLGEWEEKSEGGDKDEGKTICDNTNHK
jgi:hypothetical protein